MTAPSSV